jgi:hypothetical protein
MAQSADKYQLTFEDCPGYVYAFISTDAIDLQGAVEYLKLTLDHCRKAKQTRLMIHRDIPMTLSGAESFFASREFAEMGLDKLKIALVDQRAENMDGMKFVELTAGNRGANIKFFTNRPDAEHWLAAG